MLKVIGVERGAQGGHVPKFLEYLVILCFERRYPKRNTVASLKSKILVPRNFGLATSLVRISHSFERPITPNVYCS